jgi:hypothetical protein
MKIRFRRLLFCLFFTAIDTNFMYSILILLIHISHPKVSYCAMVCVFLKLQKIITAGIICILFIVVHVFCVTVHIAGNKFRYFEKDFHALLLQMLRGDRGVNGLGWVGFIIILLFF